MASRVYDGLRCPYVVEVVGGQATVCVCCADNACHIRSIGGEERVSAQVVFSLCDG